MWGLRCPDFPCRQCSGIIGMVISPSSANMSCHGWFGMVCADASTVILVLRWNISHALPQVGGCKSTVTLVALRNHVKVGIEFPRHRFNQVFTVPSALDEVCRRNRVVTCLASRFQDELPGVRASSVAWHRVLVVKRKSDMTSRLPKIEESVFFFILREKTQRIGACTFNAAVTIVVG